MFDRRKKLRDYIVGAIAGDLSPEEAERDAPVSVADERPPVNAATATPAPAQTGKPAPKPE